MHMAPASSVKIQRGRRAEEKQHVGREITWEEGKRPKTIGDWDFGSAASRQKFSSTRRSVLAREEIGYRFMLLLERYLCGLLLKLVFGCEFWTFLEML